MTSWTTKISGTLATADYILSNFLKNIAPTLVPLLAFIALFLLGQYLPSFLALTLAMIFLFLPLYEQSKSLPGWGAFSSFVLALFAAIIALTIIVAISIITMRLEWALLALFFLTLAFLLLLFAFFFRN